MEYPIEGQPPQQQPQQEEQIPYPIQQPIYHDNMSNGLLQYQIDSNEIIEEIEHTLKGEVPKYDSKSGEMQWVKRKESKALINDRGISVLLTILKSRLSKIFILSDFDEENVYSMTTGIGETLIDELYFHWEEYEIPSTSAASTILALVTDTVYATLRKGYLGKYLNFLKTAQRISEVQTFTEGQRQQPQQEKQGGFFPFPSQRRR